MRIVNGRSRTTTGTWCAPGTRLTLASGLLVLMAGTTLSMAQGGGGRLAEAGFSAEIPGAAASAQPERDEEMISFGQFSEAVELTTLVDFVGEVMGINVVIKGTLSGSITFNAEVEIPASELLSMLRALLEQWDYTIIETDVPGLFTVLPVGEIAPVTGGTTRVMPTPNIKPSLLVDTITTLLASSSNKILAIDELGVIVATAPPLQLDRIEQMIGEFLLRYRAQEFTRIELDYIAAPTARRRAIELVGGTSSGFGTQPLRPGGRQQNQPGTQPGARGLGAPGLDNLGDRLTVDAQGNALIFRGTREELATVIEIIDVIDVPNTLAPRNYFAGSAALQIADIASQQGLGEVITLQSNQNNTNPAFQPRNQNIPGQGGTPVRTGGPVMVVDPVRQSIIYYGTPTQQDQLAMLMEELKTEDDRIVIRHYKLNYADSEAVADLITGLISGQSATGSAPLLPGGQGRQQTQQVQNFTPPVGDDEIGVFDPTRVFVIADTDNNQVVVKAPLKQQDEFSKLIERLDLRRPQVYIEATIVSIADNSDFRIAFETQLTSGQWSGNTNFGLSSPGTNFNNARSVATNLAGLTTAIIKSQYVPVIINAIQTDANSRILSRPALLVNDNEEARIVSLEQQPTTTVNQGQATTQTSFQGFEDAGTTLQVTPTISGAGSLSLQYLIELSNFVGTGSNGIPAPRQERTVEGQVTIPSDATIVVGGIKVDNISNTIVKVPLLGDIPLIGHAFRDTRKINNSSTLYVFITPRIMTDPNFYDLKLFSRGPQSEAELERDIPEMQPVRIDMQRAPAGSLSAPAPGRETPKTETQYLEVDTSAPAPVIDLDGRLSNATDNGTDDGAGDGAGG